MAKERGYELIRRLAQGGMGEVFVARRTAGDFEKRVALKLLLPHLVSKELVARFHAEAKLAARMHHPNIVEIFDVGEADGRPFIAMQLVEGVSLSQVIRALKASQTLMPLPLVRLVASGICEALAYAHELRDERGQPLKVVHRDVTPSNILVSVAGAVQLTDFGIARVRTDQATEAGVVRGKIAYLSPEQVLHDAPVDARSDVWSAAVTLAELLTLHNPFRAETFEASLAALKGTAIQPVRARRPDVTPGLDTALSKALNRQQQFRFADARAFRAALMDGPVATAPELGAWVRDLCAADLVAEPAQEAVTGTRSVVEVTDAPVALADPPRRGRAWALVAALLLLVVGAGAWESSRQLPSAVVSPTLDAGAATVAAIVAPAPAAEPPAAEPLPSEPAPVEPGPVEPGPVDPPAALSPRPTTHPAAHRPRPRPEVIAAPAPLKVGFLSADAVPWAEVSVDGKVIDRTPFARFPLGVGRHQLAFRGPSGQLKERSVTIAENAVEAVRVDFTLEP